MPYENLRLEVRPPLALVTIDRPRVLNALSRATFDELDSVLGAIAENDEILVVLLTGAGEKSFVAGADIQELADLSAAQGQQLSARGQRVFNRIESLGKPVLACINGFALGGGCELAMACTIRLASETAKLGQPEVKLGLLPGYGGSQRLPRLVGKGAALKLLLTGELISAAEAHRIGLVDEVLAPDALMPRAEALALTMASMAPIAVRHTLAAVHGGEGLPLAHALALEASLFGLCCATEDKTEGTRAFFEKRTPVWKGR